MKDYSKIFDHYYGLQYDNNVSDVIKIHQLMEKAGIDVTASTKDKLDAYSDKRPFKVHYFISKVGKKLKWCPTNSEDKLHKMSLKPVAWWIAQLSDHADAPVVKLPDNWLDEQAKHIISITLTAELSNSLKKMSDLSSSISFGSETIMIEEEEDETMLVEGEEGYLPF
jgi:hypothetical protein